MSILEDLPFSLCQSGPAAVDGIGNYYCQIFERPPSKHAVATLYFLDSHGQVLSEIANPYYNPVQQSQINWFTDTSRALHCELEMIDAASRWNLSLVFMHIPVPEFSDTRLKICTGKRREPTEGPSVNTHFYDALVEEDVAALACGHDHVNDFCALLPHRDRDTVFRLGGPWLCHTGTCGFGGYCSYGGERFHRRARVWELDATHGSLKTWLCVQYAAKRVDEVLLVHRE